MCISKSKRSTRWKTAEFRVMVEFYSEHSTVLSSQNADISSLEKKNTAYHKLLDTVNAISGNGRDIINVKIKLSNEISRVKKMLE